jgi:nucleotide-binding universal stress UspA family protein
MAYDDVNHSHHKKTVIHSPMNAVPSVGAGLVSECVGMNVSMETLESYHPAQAITDYAEKNGVDLIVIATHGYTGMKKMLLGSIALKVLHESNVPVLLIRPEECQV